MATDQLINKAQGDAIISGLTAIKNAINDQPVPTQVEDVVADAFDEGVSYVPGDYCIHENKLYVCDIAHHGAWDGNDFTLTTVGAVLESLNNDLMYKEYTITSTTKQSDIRNFVVNSTRKPYIKAIRTSDSNTWILDLSLIGSITIGFGCNRTTSDRIVGYGLDFSNSNPVFYQIQIYGNSGASATMANSNVSMSDFSSVKLYY